MITHEDAQFSQEDRVGFEIAIPAYLTGRQVIPGIGNNEVDTLNRSVRKDFSCASLIGQNASPMYRVTK